MKYTAGLVAALLVGSGCAAPRQAERTQEVRLQEAMARSEELKARVEWETAERAKAQAALQDARRQLAALADEQKKAQARTDDLTARLKAGTEREGALRADLDLCGKARSVCEEEDVRREGEVAGLKARQDEERRRLLAELERSRGRISDLEAQALLLSAEKRKAEQEKTERVDELRQSYDELLGQAKSTASGCEEKLLEAGGQLQDADRKLQDAERTLQDLLQADEPRRKACGELEAVASRVAEALAPELESSEVLLRRRGSSLVLVLPETLFRPGSAELGEPVRALLKKIGATLQDAGTKQVAVAGFAPEPGPPAPAPAKTAKKGKAPAPPPAPLPPWVLGAGRAARVAAALEAAGVEPSGLSAVGFGFVRQEASSPAAVTLSVAVAEFPACETAAPVKEAAVGSDPSPGGDTRNQEPSTNN